MYETELAGRKLTVETGRVAELANGNVISKIWRYSCNGKCYSMQKNLREGIDFFPLSVDYEEKLYAVGKIPGSLYKKRRKTSRQSYINIKSNR